MGNELYTRPGPRCVEISPTTPNSIVGHGRKRVKGYKAILPISLVSIIDNGSRHMCIWGRLRIIDRLIIADGEDFTECLSGIVVSRCDDGKW